MQDSIQYWKMIVSMALRSLQDQGKTKAVTVIKNSELKIELSDIDRVIYEDIFYLDLIFQLKYKYYKSLATDKDSIEADILSELEQIHTNGQECIANVKICPKIEQFIDWRAILPKTKDSTIQMILDEQRMLSEVATGRLSFMDAGVEDTYKLHHQTILEIANKAGFDYPVSANTLGEWWSEVKRISTYAERRQYISELFVPLLNLLQNSEDDDFQIDFQRITSRSETIHKAVEDAEIFIQQRKYDSAVDRIHTAFHGYLKELLDEHSQSYEPNDTLTSLYTKLHSYYEEAIKPLGVAGKVKTILRGATGIINSVNELRNHNSIAHPNGQLIKEREAKLVIKLVNAIIDYLEDIETNIMENHPYSK